VVVVASDIPANRELLGERQVCAGPEEAGALLRAAVTDGSMRAQLLENQRERRGRYSARRMVADWEAVYRRLISRADR
jgi:glycosyltransferase involved in cell wall biosynthesis